MKHLFVVLGIVLVLGACKSDDTVTPGPERVCKLQYVQNKGVVDSFFYDQQFRLSRIRSGSVEYVYDYSLYGRVIINKKIYSFNAGRTTIWGDSTGRADSLLIEEDVSGNNWTKRVFTWNEGRIIEEKRTGSADADILVLQYNWHNGNLISIEHSGGHDNFSYHPQQWQPGDLNNYFEHINNGINLTPTRNLVRETPAFSGISYVFDSLGTLTQASANGEAYFFRYLCR